MRSVATGGGGNEIDGTDDGNGDDEIDSGNGDDEIDSGNRRRRDRRRG
jgi:hypothetical protein